MHKKVLIALSLCAVTLVMTAATLCHSEQFWLAQRQLKKLNLNPAQSAEIALAKADFQRKWNRTHREKGCSHHEAHASEFIAAASGVLTDSQFRKFRKRNRNPVEKVGYKIRLTGQQIDDMLKIARSL